MNEREVSKPREQSGPRQTGGFWWQVRDWAKVILLIAGVLMVLGWLSGSYADKGPQPNCDTNPTACQPPDVQYPK